MRPPGVKGAIRVKMGKMYSQTMSLLAVTSNMRPGVPSQISVLPLGQPVGAAGGLAVEGYRRLSGVLPDNLVGDGVYFDYAGEGRQGPVKAVVEYQDVAVAQVGRMVGMGYLARPPLPTEVTGGLIDDAHDADAAVADQQVAFRGHFQ